MNSERLEHAMKILGFVWRTLVVLFSIVGSILILRYTIPLIYPFIFAYLIALMIEPLVKFMEERWRIPRWGGTTISLLVVLGVFSAIITLIIIRIVNELTRLVEFIQMNIDTISEKITNWFVRQGSAFSQLEQTIQSSLEQLQQFTSFNTEWQSGQLTQSVQESLQSLAEIITNFITGLITGLGSFVGNLPFFLTVAIVILLGSFFISKKWRVLHEGGRRMVPTFIMNSATAVFTDLKRALVGFLRAQLTLMTLTALIILIGLMILRVNYALSLSLLIGLIDLLPYLGVGAIMVPWIVYLLITSQYSLAIGLTILYLITIVARQILEPKIYASNIGMDPLLILVALFVGLQLFGFLGLIIGPVVTVMIIALYRARVFHDIFNYIAGRPRNLFK